MAHKKYTRVAGCGQHLITNGFPRETSAPTSAPSSFTVASATLFPSSLNVYCKDTKVSKHLKQRGIIILQYHIIIAILSGWHPVLFVYMFILLFFILWRLLLVMTTVCKPNCPSGTKRYPILSCHFHAEHVDSSPACVWSSAGRSRVWEQTTSSSNPWWIQIGCVYGDSHGTLVWAC